MIEEVDPQQTVDTGTYRIISGDNKYLTLDVEDNYNVCHVGDPSNISGLDAMEKTQLYSYQLWYVEYLDLGYYLIFPETERARALIAEGDYDLLEANVWEKPSPTSSDTWHNRRQWKIIPNVAGGYRIVSKGAGNSQAMTVYMGGSADYTNVQMCPYQESTCQQWTFEAPSRTCYGSYDRIFGHDIEYVASSDRYKCVVCVLFLRVLNKRILAIIV